MKNLTKWIITNLLTFNELKTVMTTVHRMHEIVIQDSVVDTIEVADSEPSIELEVIIETVDSNTDPNFNLNVSNN